MTHSKKNRKREKKTYHCSNSNTKRYLDVCFVRADFSAAVGIFDKYAISQLRITPFQVYIEFMP